MDLTQLANLGEFIGGVAVLSRISLPRRFSMRPQLPDDDGVQWEAMDAEMGRPTNWGCVGVVVAAVAFWAGLCWVGQRL